MGRSTRHANADVSAEQSISKIISAAHGVIRSVPYEVAPSMHPATFVSFDADGYPSARVLVPRFVAEDMSTITINTRVETRKASRAVIAMLCRFDVYSDIPFMALCHDQCQHRHTPCLPHQSGSLVASCQQCAEIENDERASLCYHDQRGKQGWLTLKGNAARSGGVKSDGTVDVQFMVTALEIMTYNEDLTFESAKPIVLVRVEGGDGWKVKL